jgi:hypothetical protein
MILILEFSTKLKRVKSTFGRALDMLSLLASTPLPSAIRRVWRSHDNIYLHQHSSASVAIPGRC